MPSTHSFLNLEPTVRAWTLVGMYLSTWAIMEGHVDRCIGASLDLEGWQTTVVTKNIQFRNKIKILTVLANEFLYGEERTRFVKGLELIATHSGDRNMVAHDAFGADEKGDGVEFLIAKAHDKLKYPEVRWSISDVLERTSALQADVRLLTELRSAFKPKGIGASLREMWSEQAKGGIAATNPAVLQALLDRDYSPPPTTGANPPEAPQEPQEK